MRGQPHTSEPTSGSVAMPAHASRVVLAAASYSCCRSGAHLAVWRRHRRAGGVQEEGAGLRGRGAERIKQCLPRTERTGVGRRIKSDPE